MFLFLYGEDTYRSSQKLQEIIEHYKKIHKTGLNLKYYDGQEIVFEEFKNCLQSISMFKEKKLIVLKNAFSNSEFKEKFLDLFKKIRNTEDIIVFYEKGKVTQASPLFKFLKKQGKCQEFIALSGRKLENWVEKEFEKYRVEIEPKAMELLINYVGNDLWQMSQEIKKLATYKQNHAVSKEDVELLVKPKIGTDIFKTIDAIAQKDRKKAIFLIHKHLEKGDSPLYLLSMINFQFRNLLIVKDFIEKHSLSCGFPKIPGIHPFVIKKSFFSAKKFSLETLKKIYQKLFKVDQDIKTGRINPVTALDMLITEI